MSAAVRERWWSSADAAELDVLVHALADAYDEHRQWCEACKPGDCPEYVGWKEHVAECKACSGDAPLTFGAPCQRKREFIAHGHHCRRCNPCPAVIAAIAEVGEWREARQLLSRAEWLRAERDRFETGSPAPPTESVTPRPLRVLRLGAAGKGAGR